MEGGEYRKEASKYFVRAGAVLHHQPWSFFTVTIPISYFKVCKGYEHVHSFCYCSVSKNSRGVPGMRQQVSSCKGDEKTLFLQQHYTYRANSCSLIKLCWVPQGGQCHADDVVCACL